MHRQWSFSCSWLVLWSSFCCVLWSQLYLIKFILLVWILRLFNSYSRDLIFHITLFKESQKLLTCKNNLERIMIYFSTILRVSPPHGPRMRCTLLFFVGVSVKQTLNVNSIVISFQFNSELLNCCKFWISPFLLGGLDHVKW